MRWIEQEYRYPSKWNHKRAWMVVVTRHNHAIKGKIRKFSGIQTMSIFYLRTSRAIEISFELHCGDAKLLLVHKQSFWVLAEASCQKVWQENLPPGWYRLRLVGDDADIDFLLTKYNEQC